MEQELGLIPKERNPKVPAWFRKTRIIFQVVVGETNGAIVHDYLDIANLIEDLHVMGVPEETILYIPDYNFAHLVLKGYCGPIVCCWPENPLLGGETAFRQMVATAKKYRYHIMPHSSIVLLIAEYLKPVPDRDGKVRRWINPEWIEMERWSLRYADGTPHVWPMEGPSPQFPYVVRYLNHDVPEVQKFFVEGHCSLVEKYGIDAIYFDSLGNNTARIANWNHPTYGIRRAEGEAEIIGQLYKRHPELLLAAEGCTEECAGLLPLWNWRSPMAYELLGDYIYTFAHTSTASPIPQRYPGAGISPYDPNANQAEIALTKAQPNNIPRLMLNYRDRKLDDVARRYIKQLLDIKPVP